MKVVKKSPEKGSRKGDPEGGTVPMLRGPGRRQGSRSPPADPPRPQAGSRGPPNLGSLKRPSEGGLPEWRLWNDFKTTLKRLFRTSKNVAKSTFHQHVFKFKKMTSNDFFWTSKNVAKSTFYQHFCCQKPTPSNQQECCQNRLLATKLQVLST